MGVCVCVSGRGGATFFIFLQSAKNTNSLCPPGVRHPGYASDSPLQKSSQNRFPLNQEWIPGSGSVSCYLNRLVQINPKPSISCNRKRQKEGHLEIITLGCIMLTKGNKTKTMQSYQLPLFHPLISNIYMKRVFFLFFPFLSFLSFFLFHIYIHKHNIINITSLHKIIFIFKRVKK